MVCGWWAVVDEAHRLRGSFSYCPMLTIDAGTVVHGYNFVGTFKSSMGGSASWKGLTNIVRLSSPRSWPLTSHCILLRADRAQPSPFLWEPMSSRGGAGCLPWKPCRGRIVSQFAPVHNLNKESGLIAVVKFLLLRCIALIAVLILILTSPACPRIANMCLGNVQSGNMDPFPGPPFLKPVAGRTLYSFP